MNTSLPLRGPWFLLALGLASLLPALPASAGEITEKSLTSPYGVGENGQTVSFDFLIKNTNDYTMYLDYAFAGVSNTGPDSSDNALWPEYNPAYLSIKGDSSEIWEIDLTVSDPDSPSDNDHDHGNNPVTLATEWNRRPPVGVVVNPGQPGMHLIADPNNPGIASLLNGVIPGAPVYTGGVQLQAWSAVDVRDVPDTPSCLLLLVAAVTGLFARRRQRV